MSWLIYFFVLGRVQKLSKVGNMPWGAIDCMTLVSKLHSPLSINNIFSDRVFLRLINQSTQSFFLIQMFIFGNFCFYDILFLDWQTWSCDISACD